MRGERKEAGCVGCVGWQRGVSIQVEGGRGESMEETVPFDPQPGNLQ